MARTHANIFLSIVSIAFLTMAQPATHAAQPDVAAPDTGEQRAADPGWPRVFEKNGARVVLHQPQVDEWTNFSTLKLRAALQVFEKPAAECVFGIIEMTAKSRVDKEERLVLLTEPQVGSGSPRRHPRPRRASRPSSAGCSRGGHRSRFPSIGCWRISMSSIWRSSVAK